MAVHQVPGVDEHDPNIQPYQVYGGITVLWGVIIWLFCPDSPMKAKFLSAVEKDGVLLRIAGNDTGVENKQWKKDQIIEALTDIRTWLIALSAFLCQ